MLQVPSDGAISNISCTRQLFVTETNNKDIIEQLAGLIFSDKLNSCLVRFNNFATAHLQSYLTKIQRY